VSVRVSDRLDPVAYPLAAVYVAIRRYVLWCQLPSKRSADVTEGGTAHFLVVELHTSSPAQPVDTKQVVSALTRIKPLFAIQPGG
jgi:hypothetical protein